MSVHDLIVALTVVRERLTQGASRTIATTEILSSQRSLLTRLLLGSRQPAAAQTISKLGQAVERLHEAAEQIAAAERAVAAYQAAVLGARIDQTNSAEPSKAPHTAVASTGREPSDVLAGLPPFEGPGSKTRGIVLDQHGRETSMISGENARTKARAARLGLAQVWSAETHVEAHTAAWMQDTGSRHAVLIINRRPCPGMQGCDKLLPRLLPSGATLTVYGPNGFTRTYEGDEEDGQ